MLALAVLASGLLALLNGQSPALAACSGIGGLLAFIRGAYDYLNLKGAVGSEAFGVGVAAQTGLFVFLIAAVLAMVGAGVGSLERKS
jgi:hypothetical protein